jgi:outer membrane protein OmpA-like peptidoglycan-associated protein
MKYTLLILLFACGWQASSQTNTPSRIITQFSIKVLDEETAKELPADFEIRLHQAKVNFKGKNQIGQPNYSFKLLKSDTLTVITQLKGYYISEEVLVASCDTCAFYQHIVVMGKRESASFINLKVNDIVLLDKIYFNQSSFMLRPESFEQLQQLLQTLKTNPTLKIEISGHTDNVGDANLNKLLSENRAQVICNYLMSKGVETNRLTFIGYGHTKPVSPNDTEENKAKNRRVEFLVKEN